MTHPAIDSQITFLYTHDLSQTARFYEEIIGVPLKLDQGTCRIYQLTQTGYLGFCQRQAATSPPPESAPPEAIFTIVTADVDGWYEYLKERNVTLQDPPSVNPDYHIYHFFLRDPNGYLLEIQQFLHPF
ncbi:MAG: VOC family protein [Anaerolineae bacterium]|nr:VOC family protein [Anaerolineae bacterium]